MVVENVKRDATKCLDVGEIQILLAGRMAAGDVAIVILHVADCVRCRAALRDAGFDEATIAPADARSVETKHGEAAAAGQADRPTAEFAPAAVWTEGAKAASSRFPFLAPPQAPDELGRLATYRILRVLGEGGMGTVFEAEDSQLHRRVAIKVLKQGLDPTTRQRFLQEAQLAASLASDRIVTIYHIGEDRGCPFIVMELLQGESLDGKLRRTKRLPVSEALRITRESAEGLAVAHDKGLIHRDIKPANVWLEHRSAADADSRVKLLDFGIARSMAADTHLTQEGMIVGTPGYMCPEQAHSAPLDARSDLFSLGCLLYAMLAGESPFARATTMQSVRAVAEEDAPPIHKKLPGLHAHIHTLVHRLLSKQPKDRPPHARTVVDEIRRLELLVQPTIEMPSGMRTALGVAGPDGRFKLGWGGWAGITAVVAAVLIGVWVQFDHLTGNHKPPGAGAGSNPVATVPAATAEGPTPAAALPVPAVPLPPVKVGILHSFSGPMATSESPIADAFLFAIDEINAAGGVLGGRQIEPIVRDGKSYPDVFARQAEDLITQDRVVTLFGVWRSGCRKSVEEVCRKHDHMLVYPRGDEGLEQSPYVIYMGGAPNQQTTPAVKWAYAFLGKRKFFLVGTDGLFSRGSHEIIKDELAALGASVAGEAFCQIGDADFSPIVAKIKESGADVVLNTVSGTGNIGLFSALHAAGFKPDVVPVISYDLTEEELRTLTERGDDLAGNYAAWSYFQSLPDKANQDFIQRFRKRFGPNRIVNDPMAAAYAGVHLWALGVEAAKSDHVADIRQAMVHQRFEAPEGLVTIDPESQRAVRMARIGQIGKDLDFEVVWTSPKPIWPIAFPATRSRKDWEAFIQSLHDGWGGKWAPSSVSSARPADSGEKATAQ